MATTGIKYARGHVRASNKDQLIREKYLQHGHQLRRHAVPIPDELDYRTQGKVPPVRNQSQCGSCWDFSGCGTATMAFGFSGLQPMDGTFDLSEQYVLDCGSNGGCGGDDNTTVLDMCKSSGLATDAYGPYQGQAGRCQSYSGKLYKIASWGFADSAGGNGVTSTADIQKALLQFGPVGCAVAAGDDWDNYAGGETQGSGSTDINHDVMIVGWLPSTLQTGKVAWIVRNSWGTDWGMSGYMLLTEGGDQIGTETVWAQAGGTPPPGPVPPTPCKPHIPPGKKCPCPGGVMLHTAQQATDLVTKLQHLAAAATVQPRGTIFNVLNQLLQEAITETPQVVAIIEAIEALFAAEK